MTTTTNPAETAMKPRAIFSSSGPRRGEEFATCVGIEVRAELLRQGRSVADLASVLGVCERTAVRRLKGEVPFLVEELFTVGTWLNVSMSDFLGRAEKRRDRSSSARKSRGSAANLPVADAPIMGGSGAALKALRTAAGMTLEQVSDASGLSVSYIEITLAEVSPNGTLAPRHEVSHFVTPGTPGTSWGAR